MNKINIKILYLFSISFTIIFFLYYKETRYNIKKNDFNEEVFAIKSSITNNDIITMNFVGDCTLGTGINYSYKNSFIEKFNTVNDYNYFFKNVKDLFENDDLTIANLEGVLTDNNLKANLKEYNYKGPSKYAKILTSGNVDIVNLANNHTKDYYNIGYNDTKEALKQENILYFGYNEYKIIEVKNTKILFVGLEGWDYETTKKEIDKAFNYIKDKNISLTIFNFHWGNMNTYNHSKTQERIAKYAIDKGASLVVGHHPHVIQGIEKYQNKYIAYSLGNFVYGGIYYPNDTDTMILKAKFNIKNNTSDIEIIPASITSTKSKQNNFQPIIATDNEKNRILKKILKYSTNLNY